MIEFRGYELAIGNDLDLVALSRWKGLQLFRKALP